MLIAVWLAAGCGDDGTRADVGSDAGTDAADFGGDVDGGDADVDVAPSYCDSEAIDATTTELQAAFEAITHGVDETPFDLSLAEETNGRIEVGLEPGAVPLLTSRDGVFMAASRLGEGRVVAFSAQDFLSSGERSSLIGTSSGRLLVWQSALWTAGEANSPRVLVDNDNIATALRGDAFAAVDVAEVVETYGLREIRGWRAESLAGYDVAVVQVNEWGTLRVDDEGVAALRDFVSAGGGLVVAGSALHWTWWLSDQSARFPADDILDGSGLSYVPTAIYDLSTARLSFDRLASPEALLCAWLDGEAIEAIEAGELARLPGILASAHDTADARLDPALLRLIDETPALPVSRSNPLARLSAYVGAELPPHDWPAVHPWTATWPGVPDDEAQTVEGATVTIAVERRRTVPLGYYAPPGAEVQLTFSPDHVATGLVVHVGEPYDDNRELEHIDPWTRAPMLYRRFAVDSPQLEVGLGFGGSIHLVIPDEYDVGADIEVSVDGAIPQALFSVPRGSTGADGDWAGPTADESGAPQAILEAVGKLRMVVPTERAAEVDDPGATLDFWSGFHTSHETLAQEPAPRPFESHWVFDIQVGWGYANATSGTFGRITFPDVSIGWALRTETGNEDWWLFGHELGHQFQTSDWSGGDVTEVCVNLFTMYTLNSYINDGGNFETVGHQDNIIDHAALESARWATADLFGKLEMYRQLVFEFGWDAYIETFASYHDDAYPRDEFGSFMDGFAIRFSAVVERDITPFLLHWEYPVSGAAVDVVRGFGYEGWLPEGW